MADEQLQVAGPRRRGASAAREPLERRRRAADPRPGRSRPRLLDCPRRLAGPPPRAARTARRGRRVGRLPRGARRSDGAPPRERGPAPLRSSRTPGPRLSSGAPRRRGRAVPAVAAVPRASGSRAVLAAGMVGGGRDRGRSGVLAARSADDRARPHRSRPGTAAPGPAMSVAPAARRAPGDGSRGTRRSARTAPDAPRGGTGARTAPGPAGRDRAAGHVRRRAARTSAATCARQTLDAERHGHWRTAAGGSAPAGVKLGLRRRASSADAPARTGERAAGPRAYGKARGQDRAGQATTTTGGERHSHLRRPGPRATSTARRCWTATRRRPAHGPPAHGPRTAAPAAAASASRPRAEAPAPAARARARPVSGPTRRSDLRT